MHGYVERRLAAEVTRELRRFPAVALLGPRQCGKTTLAKEVAKQRQPGRDPAVYLDLEKPSDQAKLRDPEVFLRRHAGRLVCLDEVQRVPGLFEVLRALIDEDRRPGRFLLLGSASPALLRQSSESLAGRASLLELTPLLLPEVAPGRHASLERLWLRGGFPDSVLAANDEASLDWRGHFVRTFLERDIPQLGFRVAANTLRRFWRMCAHLQGQVLNLSALGRSIETSHTAARHHLEILEQTFVVRSLPALEANLGKRLVKSPKVYLRDSGVLHALLDIETEDDLAGHPVFGASWEGFVIEQTLAVATGWRASFYRTAQGAELDLVLEKRNRRIAVECKASSAPTVSRGFWTALADLGIREAYVVARVEEAFPLGKKVEALPLLALLARL
ncbi:MAG: ATPase [Deltaproteobacteria bacterium RBG_16_71_12]|nr:MAG: ATPase [Deltaproteobacteria bacterium RBG_16_71_12]